MTARGALAVFGVGVLFSLLLNLPASWLVPSSVKARADVTGSVFDGSVYLHNPAAVRLRWQLNKLPLLYLKLAAGLRVSGPQLNGSGVLAYHFGDVYLDRFRGQLDAALIGELLEESRVQLRGPINVELDELIVSSATGIPRVAEGALAWPRGSVRAPDPSGQLLDLDVPPLRGTLSTDDEGVHFDVNESDGSLVAQVRIGPDGMATITVYRRVLSWRNGKDSDKDDAVLFKSQRMLFEG